MVVSESPKDSAVAAPLQHLPSITLSELQAEAAFLIRRDRKYVIPLEEARRSLSGLDPTSRILDVDGRREFAYTTRYFDDEHTAYFRSLRQRPDRFKVRTRLYDDTGICQLEVKLRDGRGLTVKERRPRDRFAVDELSGDDRVWLRGFPQIGPHADRLEACVSTHYRRTTVVFPGSSGRMTIDWELSFAGPDGVRLALPGYAIIETKGTGRPAPFDRYLWANGWRPISVSKFALSVSLLFPELPANRWHRLRTHLEANVEGR